MRPKTISYALATLDRDGIAKDDHSAAGNFTLDGALTASGAYTADSPRHIGFYAANDESGKTFTITGTDRFGEAMTEAVTGPDAGSTASTKNFATVTAIASDAATTGDVEVGTYGSAETQWVSVDRIGPYAVSLVKTTMVCDYEVQFTLNDLWGSSWDEHAANAAAITDYDLPVTAIRVAITGMTTGGTATIRILSSTEI